MSPSATTTSSNKGSGNNAPEKTLLSLPTELQVYILTYLRAYDLAVVTRVCRYYRNPDLIHSIVSHTAETVYPPDLTKGFDKQPTSSTVCLSTTTTTARKKKAASVSNRGGDNPPSVKYTLEHMRNLELLVVARILSRPEPNINTPGSFYVSKSWCKTALKWLEVTSVEEQQQQHKKKVSKKQQRMRQRQLREAQPPSANVNGDILCEHARLQLLSHKSARARRRLMDKQAWKCLKKLYPDAVALESTNGECSQCLWERQNAEGLRLRQLAEKKVERKAPLNDEHVRRFYTRTRGVPVQKNGDSLAPGEYSVLPRAWCHGWRHYMKTGEGSNPPPDASCLFCEHQLPLLPPHLEAFLFGGASQLWSVSSQDDESDVVRTTTEVVGLSTATATATGYSDEATTAMALGMSTAELERQRLAMATLERQRQYRRRSGSLDATTKNERLDQENYCCVEIVTQEEWKALANLWSTSNNNGSSLLVRLSFTVDVNHNVTFADPCCRRCDASRKINDAWDKVVTPHKSLGKKQQQSPRPIAHLDY